MQCKLKGAAVSLSVMREFKQVNMHLIYIFKDKMKSFTYFLACMSSSQVPSQVLTEFKMKVLY